MVKYLRKGAQCFFVLEKTRHQTQKIWAYEAARSCTQTKNMVSVKICFHFNDVFCEIWSFDSRISKSEKVTGLWLLSFPLFDR